MTRQRNRFEWMEEFTPSITMATLTAIWFGARSVQANKFQDVENIHSEHFLTLQLSRLIDASDLSIWDQLAYFVFLASSFEVLNYVAVRLGGWIHAKELPVRGKHLDELTQKDHVFLWWNKIANGPFVLFAFFYANWDPNFLCKPDEMTWVNVALAFPIFFAIYDFFYTLGHMFLHVRGVYPLIHKHHHRQQAPSRGNVDALNVHPVEYAFGQYNALWTLFLMCRFMNVHIVGANLIMFATNAASCFNHQRYDIKIPFFGGINLYEAKCHELHHRIPNVNFGQYIMLWDWVFGSFRPYCAHDKDPVNPMSQLDPQTGKTLAYMKQQQKKAA